MTEFSYDYFLHPEKDGNSSLASKADRINDACKLFKNGETIFLKEDSKMVQNEHELVDAITSFANMEPPSQKIYYQDDKVLIGSKVWEFQGTDSTEVSKQRKKTIPVSAISSVDFVSPKRWWWILLIFLGISAVITLFVMNCTGFGFDELWWGYLLGIIAIIIGSAAVINKKGFGDIEVITNNATSGYRYKGIQEDKANVYLEPMRQCLLEKK